MGLGLRVGIAMERRSSDWAFVVARIEETLARVFAARRLKSFSADGVEGSVKVSSGDGFIEIVGSGDKGGGFLARGEVGGGVKWEGDGEAEGVVGKVCAGVLRLGDDGCGISVGV